MTQENIKDFREYINESYRKVFRSYDYTEIKKQNLMNYIYSLCGDTEKMSQGGITLTVDNALLLGGMLREIDGDDIQVKGNKMSLHEKGMVGGMTNAVKFSWGFVLDNVECQGEITINLNDETITITKEQ